MQAYEALGLNTTLLELDEDRTWEKMQVSKLGSEPFYDLWYRIIIENHMAAEIMDEYLITMREDSLEAS